MTNSGEVAGVRPAAICWPTVPLVDGAYSLSVGTYPVVLPAPTGTMVLSRPPTPASVQAPPYHFFQESGAILPAMGARATCP